MASKDRVPWNANGSYPCNTNHCYTGVGQIDVVMTPLGGTGWLIGEDFLDKEIVRRVEDATQNRLLIDTVRVALNPIRSGANMLHGEHPWYRASRDGQGMDFFHVTRNLPCRLMRSRIRESPIMETYFSDTPTREHLIAKYPLSAPQPLAIHFPAQALT